MTKTRTWSAATAGICVLLILAAWFLLISPTRADAADLRDQTLAQDQANQQTRLKIQQLKAQYAALPAKQAELAVIKKQLPDNPELPALIRTLSAMAEASGVVLVSLAPAPPAPFVAAGTAPAAGPAVAGSTQLLGVATNLVVKGDFASSTLFLQKLQAASTTGSGSAMSRAFLVQSVNVVPDTTMAAVATIAAQADIPELSKAASGYVQMTVTGQVFVLKTSAVTTIATPIVPSTTPSGTAPPASVGSTS